MAPPGKVRGFSPVPRRAVKLAPGPLRVLVALGCYVNRDGQCWPSQSTLALDLGMTDRSVRRFLVELVDQGFLELTVEPGKQSTYTIKYDTPGQSMTPDPVRPGYRPTPDSESPTTPDSESPHTPDSESPTNYLTELNQGTTKSRRRSNGSVPYAFEGAVIRVTVEQLATWQKAFNAIPDVLAELRSLDDYYAVKGGDGWFHRTSTNLAKRHQKLLAEGVTPKRRRRQVG